MLHECIQFLIEDLSAIDNNFDAAKNGREFNFVIDIQPFTEQVDGHLNDFLLYKDEIIAMRLMNPIKLDLMVTHLKELSVACFFEKTSKKVFIDQFKAVQHDLHYIERQSSL
ncbi:DUF1798 family protein [Macrococcus lamae]|uniref:DUF1798 family protein n=1 Tax=Macrococcus lamae TaxID=198484 RepID=A0A4R6BXM0_9STAP|nr:DUF1798 family protein [Macrococcus lamae]TDM13241.1 DUF1798 family protein [Macrococcus lamae]